MDNNQQAEPFPALEPVLSSREITNGQDQTTSTSPSSAAAAPQDVASHGATRPHRASTRTRKTRTASLLQNLIESSPPLGAWQAIGEDTAKGPTIPEIKNGSYNIEGWSHEGQLEQRNLPPQEIHARRISRASSLSRGSRKTRNTTTSSSKAPVVPEIEEMPQKLDKEQQRSLIAERSVPSKQVTGPDDDGVYPNGYRFPKQHTWQQSFAIYGAAFWKFFWTIKGFLITVYGLNVVAWGAMIFFLLIPGATPAMCHPDCDDKRYSSRQIWIENCSQILTALFCVTAFGLLPWRLRDFYYMIRYQAMGDYDALRKLAGFYRGWYRLPGSDKLPDLLGPPPKPDDLKVSMFGNVSKQAELDEDLELDLAALQVNPAIPLPPWSMPDAPLTGIRARPTKFSQLAIMIWAYILNTLFQVGLCVVMWGFNRFQRNHAYFSALTALFIVLGCGTGIAAGIVVGREGKVIKNTEGIPVKDYDTPESPEDYRERLLKQEKKQQKKNKKNKKQKDVEKQETVA